jgi:CRISP-associated protein Cas1
MLKRTLYFANPFYLSTRNEQLLVQEKEGSSQPQKPIKTIPIEDIGFLLIDHPQVTISHSTTQKLVANNVAVIYCDEKHLPTAVLLPFEGNSIQNERFRAQLEVSEPLRKQLWQQTIKAKIENQATVLEQMTGQQGNLLKLQKEVASGDTTNREAVAAKYYWGHLFKDYIPDFQRERFGVYPNNLLNYGYAILRAATARAIVGVGLHCTLGINHHNRNNAFCLADDLMEPYRPFVDRQVAEIVTIEHPCFSEELSMAHKQKLLSLLATDTDFGEMKSPLMIALHRTAVSLLKCYEGELRKLSFPTVV